MPHDIGCWKCGASLAELSLPFGRIDRCRQCGADLHACKLCALYDPRAYQQCREPTVEEVRDKERANFCDHYKPVAGAFKGGSSGAADVEPANIRALVYSDAYVPESGEISLDGKPVRITSPFASTASSPST